MQRQAVPLLRPERPLVGTGTERQIAVDSGQVIVADRDGEVLSAHARAVEVRYDDGTLAKKVFTSPDEAIGFLREKTRDENAPA